MRVVALVAVYNEERFIKNCLDHLIRQGIEVYLIDNGSTDATASIADAYRGRGVVAIETLPRSGEYSWRPILERKEQLAAALDADWFMHVDADELRIAPPVLGRSLPEAFAAVERHGSNAVNFFEFTFVPTREAPDHDHPRYLDTMRWYYPFDPSAAPTQLKAWKRQPVPVELAWSAGHQVRFPGLRVHPIPFPMRHYLFLSVDHAIRKYVRRRYDPAELAVGWHRARAALTGDRIVLPSQHEMRPYVSDDLLDPTAARTRHYVFDAPAAPADR